MISKKWKKKKADVVKGEEKYLPIEVDGRQEKLDKKLKIKKERFQEHMRVKADRKKQPDNKDLKIEISRQYKQCKNSGCGRQRRHGSAYCGKD